MSAPAIRFDVKSRWASRRGAHGRWAQRIKDPKNPTPAGGAKSTASNSPSTSNRPSLTASRPSLTASRATSIAGARHVKRSATWPSYAGARRGRTAARRTSSANKRRLTRSSSTVTNVSVSGRGGRVEHARGQSRLGAGEPGAGCHRPGQKEARRRAELSLVRARAAEDRAETALRRAQRPPSG